MSALPLPEHTVSDTTEIQTTISVNYANGSVHNSGFAEGSSKPSRLSQSMCRTTPKLAMIHKTTIALLSVRQLRWRITACGAPEPAMRPKSVNEKKNWRMRASANVELSLQRMQTRFRTSPTRLLVAAAAGPPPPVSFMSTSNACNHSWRCQLAIYSQSPGTSTQTAANVLFKPIETEAPAARSPATHPNQPWILQTTKSSR